MSATVCLSPGTVAYPQGAGHLWAYLNWALSLRAAGCRVLWLEDVGGMLAGGTLEETVAAARTLDVALGRFGLAGALALTDFRDEPVPAVLAAGRLGLDDVAAAAEILLDFTYEAPASVVRRFARSALVDVDPGLLQIGMDRSDLNVAPHDVYFTIGETVGTPGACFPDGGVSWQYTPPPVCLDAWEVSPLPEGGAYTTVTNWWGEWIIIGDETVDNEKRTAFLSLVDLPGMVSPMLELALTPDEYTLRTDGALLRQHGWTVRDAWAACGTPEAYRDYIRGSRGELSATKASCRVLANAWVSDRTVCYLASGRPAVVEHTGPSRILPDAEGLLRFRNVGEAAAAIRSVEEDPAHHARAARALAEEHFDGERLVAAVLERALS